MNSMRLLHRLLLAGVVMGMLVPAVAAQVSDNRDFERERDRIMRDLEDDFFEGSDERDLERLFDNDDVLRELSSFPGDFDEERVLRRSYDQSVDLDRNTVLTALALGDRIDLDEILDIDIVTDRDATLRRTIDLDRDDALLARALDVDLDRDLFEDGTDIDIDFRDRRDLGRSIDLDFDDVILARALDSSIDLEDIADIDFDEDRDRTLRARSGFDRDDLFSILLLTE
ncbi:MAG TPA: hypothetical protein VM889_13275 [Candidatus Thermoplasmatota archaeon]|nr:hypothetical protein [Candidatus Thermoplasmatota archaeon]